MKVEASGDALDATVREFASGKELFNRYTLKQILGRGGMGIVWLASDDVLERDVALKFLPELIILDRAMLSDLKRETKRSLELTHKNIVRIYDFVHDETSACISMEYIDGDTLSNLRADRPKKAFETHELTDWMKQLCDALDYAHNHAHVVHRDLKPSNLMLKQQGELKVADFGIARSLSDSVSMLTMGARGTSGTLVYMSPQQLDGERGSHLDDVYSFGATFYELLTSKPPFYSGNIDRQIHERVPPPMNNRRVELEIEGEPIDEVWEKLVAACLQKDPARRPQSALEIVERLTMQPSARKTGWFKFSTSQKTRPATAETRPPTAKTRSPTAKPPLQPEVPRQQHVSKKRFRRATLAITAAISAAIQATAHGAALAIIVPSKAISRGAAVGVAGAKKDFQDAVLEFSAAGKAISRGAAAGVSIVIAASRTILRGTAAMVFAASKETLRGAAVTVIPAAAVAACVWYFAIRPPPKPHIAQPLAKTQPSQPPKAQPSAVPMESHIANIALPGLLLEPPAAQGGLSLDTAPGGAKVIVDGGSIMETSPATLSNLAVGKHHLQIAMEGYVTEEMDAYVNAGRVTSLGVITLHAREQSPIAAEAKSKEEPTTPPLPAKNRAKKKPAVAAKPERSAHPAAQQAAATPAPPPAKITSKPAATPDQKRRRPEFEGSAPGG